MGAAQMPKIKAQSNFLCAQGYCQCSVLGLGKCWERKMKPCLAKTLLNSWSLSHPWQNDKNLSDVMDLLQAPEVADGMLSIGLIVLH